MVHIYIVMAVITAWGMGVCVGVDVGGGGCGDGGS